MVDDDVAHRTSKSFGTWTGQPCSTNWRTCDNTGSFAVQFAILSAVMSVSSMVDNASTIYSGTGTCVGTSGSGRRLRASA